ncbi:CCA tRNA nucleotidyltransferase, partial [Candidatus Micrarchaeota archaeon]|nr:CCA tRNA nucleotidyltransferase [Candidatus Micrarchaeota archaeon]
LPKIKPNPKEKKEELEISNRIISKIRSNVPKYIEVELAGSLAKNTNLRSDRDFDIFLLFPKEYSKKDLVTLGLDFAKKAIAPHKYTIGYAEHPYLRAVIENCKVDIVPAFKILYIEERASSVDRSQLHTRYVQERLNEEGCDQVRLLKKFLKNLGIYGAEVKIEGFSGYLCELLIIHYGSFKKLLQEASKWDSIVIDIEKHYDEKILGQKFNSPLVVIDPVDRDRNVAAVISETTLSKFIFACREFLKNPNEDFFFKPIVKINKKRIEKEIRGRESEIICLVFKAPKVVPDILWPQLKRTATNVVKQLEVYDFKLLGYDFWSDEKDICAILLEFQVFKLPKTKKVYGPDIKFARDMDEFVKHHKATITRPWLEGKKIVALEKRKYTDASELLKAIASNPKKYGVASYLIGPFKKFKMLKGTKILQDKLFTLAAKYLTKQM